MGGSFFAPDAIEPIVAWRAWYVVSTAEGTRLRSVIRWRFIWPTRAEIEATCAYGPEHEKHGEDPRAPSEGCTCGLYAASGPKRVKPYLISLNADAVREDDLWRAFGKVLLWGRVVAGTTGWRAQYAYPHSIALPAKAVGFEDQLDVAERERLAAELREAYGVPVVAEISPHRALLRRLR